MHISHANLENWRNFKAAAVPLQKRMFLVGPNASGKSNFLDAFRFLSDLVSIGGGFEQAVSKRGGVSRIRCLSARRYPEICVKVKVVDESTDTFWEYELAFVQDNRQRPQIARERISLDGKVLLERPDKDDKRDLEQLRQTHIEQVRVNKKFRELATFFGSIDFFHVVPQLIRDPDKYRGQSNDPYGWDFLERISKTPERTRNAWLRRIQDALKVAVPQLQEFDLWRDDRGVPHLRGRYEHWRRHGAWQTEEAFSDGTIRLIGLLWSVLEGSGPLLLEEPEMSIHPKVVEFIPEMLARMQRRTGRQVLISTHSPDLLRNPGIGIDEVALLQPSSEGTTIVLANSIQDVEALLEGGISMADVIIPVTKPREAEQIGLFGDY